MIKHILISLITIVFFNIHYNFAQTIELTTINKCNPKVMKLNNSNLFLGATGIFKYDNKRWVDISNNISHFFYVNNIVFSKTKIIINTTYGIFSSSLNNYKWKKHKQFFNDINHLIEVNDSVYLVCSSGIFLFDNAKEQFIAIQSVMPVNSVLSAVYYDDKIWITNWKSGVWYFSLKSKTWSKVGNLTNDFISLYKSKDNIYVKKNGYYRFDESDSLKWVKTKISPIKNLKFEDKKKGIRIYENSILYPSYTIYKGEEEINIRNKLNREITNVYYLDSMFIITTSDGVYTYNVSDDTIKSMNTGAHSSAYRKYFTDGENAIISYDEIGSNLFITYNKGKEWVDLNKTFNIPRKLYIDDVIKVKDDIHLITSKGYYKINIKEKVPKLIIDSLELYNIVSIDDSILLIGTNKGILKTTNNGVNWQFTYELDGDFNDRIYSIKSFKKLLLANVNGNRLIVSHDNGISWKELRRERKRAFGLYVTKKTIYWFSVFGEINITNDLSNWSKMPYSSFIYLNSLYINGYVIKRLNDGYVYMLKDNSLFIDKKYFYKNAIKVQDIEPNALSISKSHNKLFILYKNKIQGYEIK